VDIHPCQTHQTSDDIFGCLSLCEALFLSKAQRINRMDVSAALRLWHYAGATILPHVINGAATSFPLLWINFKLPLRTPHLCLTPSLIGTILPYFTTKLCLYCCIIIHGWLYITMSLLTDVWVSHISLSTSSVWRFFVACPEGVLQLFTILLLVSVTNNYVACCWSAKHWKKVENHWSGLEQ